VNRLPTQILTLCSALLFIVRVTLADGTVEGRVISVAGNSAFINIGRDNGAFVGSRVIFKLRNGDLVEAPIVDITAGNARVDLPIGSVLPASGDRADVEVKQEEPAKPEQKPTENPADQTPPAQKPPEHPPWQSEFTKDPNAPLLAPAFGTRPSDRPMTVKGRSYSTIRITDDIENGNTYTYARSGLWLDVRNPLGDGGRLLFQGESEYRSQPGVNSDNEGFDANLMRLSYAWGLDREAPFRGEVGRFISVWLPELGVFDGAEGAVRLQNGISMGAGTGYYPTDTEELPSGQDDFGFHVFADYQDESAPRLFQATIGYQQTFDDGETDRSLVIGRILANPSDDVRLFGMAMVDLYDNNDTLETSTAEITQAVLQASFRFTPTTGGILSYSHYAWPELNNDQSVFVPPWLVTDGQVDRFTGTWWTKLDKDWRLSLRGNWWQDQSREGYGGEVSLDWTMPTERPSLSFITVYYEDAAYTEGLGLRLQNQTQFGDFNLLLGYDGFMYTTDVDVGESGYLNNAIRGDITWSKGPWYFDIDASYLFGDGVDGIAVGLSVQYRF